MTGVVTAVVKDIDAAQGRLQLDYQSLQPGLASTWAPVAAPMTGKDRGMLFMPEAGDEVLVAFEQGDFDHPFVVGFLWNGEQVSPEHERQMRVIVTPGGHQLRFEDKENDTRVVLKSKGGHKITLEDKAPNPKIEIKSQQHTITMDDTLGASRVEIQAGAAAVTITMTTTPPTLAISLAGTSLNVNPAGVGLTSPGLLTVTTAGVANITCAAANLTTGVLNVTAGLSNFSGVLRADSVVTNAVVSPLYTPGLGNLI
jgi:phage baseplate assembly protein gpV